MVSGCGQLCGGDFEFESEKEKSDRGEKGERAG